MAINAHVCCFAAVVGLLGVARNRDAWRAACPEVRFQTLAAAQTLPNTCCRCFQCGVGGRELDAQPCAESAAWRPPASAAWPHSQEARQVEADYAAIIAAGGDPYAVRQDHEVSEATSVAATVHPCVDEQFT